MTSRLVIRRLILLIGVCLVLSVVVNQNLLKIDLFPPEESSLWIPQSLDRPTMSALDKLAPQPDERSKLHNQLRQKLNSQKSIKVFVFPFHLKAWISNEGKHFIYDGIVQSKHLDLIRNISLSSKADVWVTYFRIGYRPKYWCHVLEKWYSRTASTPESRPPIINLDWDDHPELYPCHNLTTLTSNCHYSKRSVVKYRDFVDNWVKVGKIDTYSNWRQFANSPVYTLHYGVRSDLVDVMEKFLNDESNSTTNRQSLYDFDIVHRNRTIDVAHFWPSGQGQRGGKSQGIDRGSPLHNNAQLRDRVSLTIDELHNSNRNIHAVTGLVGKADGKGRDSAQLEYARYLLETKIIIVAQRDHWEGSFRLMEGKKPPPLFFAGMLVHVNLIISTTLSFG